MTGWFAGPFRPHAELDPAALRRSMESAGFSREALLAMNLGEGPIAPWKLRAAVAGKGRLESLVRLLLLGDELPEAEVAEAFAPVPISTLGACGLLRLTAGRARAEATLLPMDGRLTLRDFDPVESRTEMRPDHVPSISLSTSMVAALTPRVRVARALDIGCGSGYQALRLAAHAERVVATDVNQRALNFAAMMMTLNSVGNVELRRGSFFEPVAGERFGVIATNPPFIISPDLSLIFRDSGMRGDGVSEMLLSRLPDFLDEGGWATMLFNWHHRAASDWHERPVSWVRGRGCDAWLIKFRADDAETYARTWLAFGRPHLTPHEEQRLSQWMAHYAEIGAEVMCLGAMILRRRTPAPNAPPNWIRWDAPPVQDGLRDASSQVVRVFEAETMLRGPGAEQLLIASRPRLANHHLLEEYRKVEGGRWTVKGGRLRLTEGLESRCNVNEAVTDALALFDGTRTCEEVFRAVSAKHGMDYDAALPQMFGTVAWLMRAGYFEGV